MLAYEHFTQTVVYKNISWVSILLEFFYVPFHISVFGNPSVAICQLPALS